MDQQSTDQKQSPIERLAAFIVDKRKAFYLLYIGLAIFCVFASGWVEVNDDLTSYLPAETETRRGLTVMEEEFVTFLHAVVGHGVGDGGEVGVGFGVGV